MNFGYGIFGTDDDINDDDIGDYVNYELYTAINREAIKLRRQKYVLFAALCRLKANDSWVSRYYFDEEDADSIFAADCIFVACIRTAKGNIVLEIPAEEWNLFDGIREIDKEPKTTASTPDDQLEALIGLIE
jgi:hypothetical protein